MSDYGIKVSTDGSDVLTATDTDVLLNISDPLAKLDTSNTLSFRNITFTFSNDPPEPTGIGADIYRTTLVYSFAHGYSYIPATWFLVQLLLGVTGATFEQDYFQDRGVVAAHSVDDEALFYTTVDSTNVNFYVQKFFQSGGTNNNLTGVSLRIRSYIFVEDVGV